MVVFIAFVEGEKSEKARKKTLLGDNEDEVLARRSLVYFIVRNNQYHVQDRQ